MSNDKMEALKRTAETYTDHAIVAWKPAFGGTQLYTAVLARPLPIDVWVWDMGPDLGGPTGMVHGPGLADGRDNGRGVGYRTDYGDMACVSSCTLDGFASILRAALGD